MKTLVTLCFMVSLGLVVAQNGRGPCGCRRVFDFCANDYTTYHSICEYKCKHPSTPFEDWYILYHGPCSGPEIIEQPQRIYESDKGSMTTLVPTLIPGYQWEPRTGSSYKFHGAAQTWNTARDICHKEGGYLAIINSRTESTILKDMFRYVEIIRTPYWYWYHASLGFRKLDDRWETIQGESLKDAGFDEWHPGEPNNRGGDENCGSMHRNGQLNDIPCNTLMFAFICEYTPKRE